MKIFMQLLFIICLVSLFSCANSQGISRKDDGKVDKVDSVFNRHFKILDDLSKKGSDSTRLVTGAINFMERMTGIKSNGNRSYIGVLSFTDRNLEAWHKWYDDNKNKLVWDAKAKTIWKRSE